MAAEKPAIVVVPGAWHTPEHHDPLTKLLRNAGYETLVVRNPSVSVSRDPGNMLQKDARVTSDVLRKLVNDESKDVVLVMHSYGGIAGPEAVGMFCEAASRNVQSEPNPDAGRIRRMVFLAAHVLEKGDSLDGSGGKIPNVEVSEKGMMTHKQPFERYYSGDTREHAQAALDLLQPMAQSAMTTPTSYAGWKDYGIPVTYIKCLSDAAVTQKHWDVYLPRLRDAGVDLTVEEMDSDHSPFWERPQELFELLKRAM